MFYDCGSKVKIVAIVVMVLSAICAFISLLLPFFNTYTVGRWWVGLLGAIGLVISGYITSLVLYTIGDAWEKTQNAEFHLVRLLKSSEKSELDEQEKKKTTSTVTPKTPVLEDGWRCSCGHINNAMKSTCSRCGKGKE